MSVVRSFPLISIISHRGTIHHAGSQRQQSLRDRRNWYIGWSELIVVGKSARRIYSHSSHGWRRATWTSRALQPQQNTLDIHFGGRRTRSRPEHISSWGSKTVRAMLNYSCCFGRGKRGAVMMRSHNFLAGCSPLGERSGVQQKPAFSSGGYRSPQAACDCCGASVSTEDSQAPSRHGQLLPALPDTR